MYKHFSSPGNFTGSYVVSGETEDHITLKVKYFIHKEVIYILILDLNNRE